MPSYYGNKPNPKELRSHYDSQRLIAQLQMLNSKPTGFIGTPIGDADSFTKLVKAFEDVENNLEGFLPSLEKLKENPERAVAGSTNDLFISLNTAKKLVSRISLRALPITDVDAIKAYKDSLDAYNNLIAGYKNEILAIQAGLPPRDKDVFKKTEIDLQKINDQLSLIIQSIDAQVAIYNSGVAQPVKLGGCMDCFNLDDPKSSPMYQNQQYISAMMTMPKRFL